VVLKSVLIRVDLPNPDSPAKLMVTRMKNEDGTMALRTNNHGGKLKTFPHTFTVNLIWEISESNVAHEFFADDVGKARVVSMRSGSAVCQTV
jgi:hypothetical protein